MERQGLGNRAKAISNKRGKRQRELSPPLIKTIPKGGYLDYDKLYRGRGASRKKWGAAMTPVIMGGGFTVFRRLPRDLAVNRKGGRRDN